MIVLGVRIRVEYVGLTARGRARHRNAAKAQMAAKFREIFADTREHERRAVALYATPVQPPDEQP